MALGAWTRHYFNLRHKGRNEWWILASAAFGLIVLAILIKPDTGGGSGQVTGPAPAFATVQRIVNQRCAPCHSPNPTQPGMSSPGAGVLLDTPERIRDQANLIRVVAVDSTTMPLGNATHMTDAERQTLANWIASR